MVFSKSGLVLKWIPMGFTCPFTGTPGDRGNVSYSAADEVAAVVKLLKGLVEGGGLRGIGTRFLNVGSFQQLELG